jgi:hypothetical protein
MTDGSLTPVLCCFTNHEKDLFVRQQLHFFVEQIATQLATISVDNSKMTLPNNPNDAESERKSVPLTLESVLREALRRTFVPWRTAIRAIQAQVSTFSSSFS